MSAWRHTERNASSNADSVSASLIKIVQTCEQVSSEKGLLLRISVRTVAKAFLTREGFELYERCQARPFRSEIANARAVIPAPKKSSEPGSGVATVSTSLTVKEPMGLLNRLKLARKLSPKGVTSWL
jgi:hypothetical protein